MKNSILFPLIIAGLAFGGCNATRTDTASAETAPSSTGYTTAGASTSTAPSPSGAAAQTGAFEPSSQQSGSTYGSTGQSSPGASSTSSDSSRTTSAISSPSSTSPTTYGSAGSTGTGSTGTTDSTYGSTAAGASPGTSSTDTSSPAAASSSTTASTSDPSQDLETRMTEWRLSAAEIKSDLERGTPIERSKESTAGAPTGTTDDTVLETMVKGKLQADSKVGKAMIEVDAQNGAVKLSGSASQAEEVARAMALALDTQGVSKVTSEIKVDASSHSSTEKR